MALALTDEQRGIVDGNGNVLLLACPGSGKTRAAAARADRLVGEGTKVGICSYTNVGAERIGRVLRRDLGAVLGPEHFLGTLHNFLIQYVVRPFAHAVGATAGPFIRVGDWPEVRVDGDNTKRIALDDFRRTPDGGVAIAQVPYRIHESPEYVIASVGAEVIRRKEAFFRRAGVLSLDDAMWVALQALENPYIARAVARRFDEILIDEAQDTSELQLACLDRIMASGKLGSLVLVGDLEQSIYSFQGASADGCRALAETHGLRTEALSENHRCSQLICNIATNFCEREKPDVAVGETAGCEIQPELVLYPATEPAAAMELYRARLEHHGIAEADAAVLARVWRVVDALSGKTAKPKVEPMPTHVGRLAARFHSGRLTRHDVAAIERLIARAAWDDVTLEELEPEVRRGVRTSAGRFLGALPPLETDLESWVRGAAAALDLAARELVDKPHRSGPQVLRAKTDYSAQTANEVFAQTPPLLRPQTVHEIKGEDRDAVMLVVHRPTAGDKAKQLELWEDATAGRAIAPDQGEERRITFVALTRARRLAVVALPDNSRGREVARACVRLGFRDATAAAQGVSNA